MRYVTAPPELQALFSPVGEASVKKEGPVIHPAYRAWIEASPFLVLATAGEAGLDVSPRGDPAPIVRIGDERTLLLPERRGNNRIDSLRNIVANPNVPTAGEMLAARTQGAVGGKAYDDELPARQAGTRY